MFMNYVISVIWLLVFIAFIIFAYRHHIKSRQPIQSLEVLQPMAIDSVEILGVDFGKLVDTFRQELNQANQESHRIARNSFILAAITALISLIISIVQLFSL